VVVVRSGSWCAGTAPSRSAWRCAARAVSWPTAARTSVAAGVAGFAAVSRRVLVRLLLGLPGAVLLGVLAARAAVPPDAAHGSTAGERGLRRDAEPAEPRV
jgi:hypothetical protein